MYKIDLNSDLGEGAAFDADIIPMITSANIACGYHAGDDEMMKKTIALCKSAGIAFGAHPGYPDRENFGRTNMDVTPDDVYKYTFDQLKTLNDFAKAEGVSLQHVKPHGAMYNMAAKNYALSEGIVSAIKDFDDSLIIMALSGSEMINAAKNNGIKYASEVFADRAYEADGSLRQRKLEGSMITDEEEAISRVVRMIVEGKVTAYTGEDISIEAHSVCVHGDGPKALDFVKRLNDAFKDNGIILSPIGD